MSRRSRRPILESYSEGDLSEAVTQSIEADAAFLKDPEGRMACLVDGSMGEEC